MWLALACTLAEPGPLVIQRVEGTFRVESAAMGTEGIVAQRKAIRAAQDAWVGAHGSVAHRFDTMPFVAARNPSGGERLQELPGMPLRATSDRWVVVALGRGFTDLADGACFTDGDCPGDLGFSTASATCAGCPAAPAGIRVVDREGRMREVDALRALEFVHTRWAAEHRVAAVQFPFRMDDRSYDDPIRCAEAHPALSWMVTTLRNDGIAVVAAAGDERLDGRLPAPACVPGVVSVAATGPAGVSDLANVAPFLSLGAPGATSADASGVVARKIAGLRGASPGASLPDAESALFGETVELPARGGRKLRALAN